MIFQLLLSVALCFVAAIIALLSTLLSALTGLLITVFLAVMLCMVGVLLVCATPIVAIWQVGAAVGGLFRGKKKP